MSIPAWKRLGLQVKDEVKEGPLGTTTHLEHDTVTNKLAKKLNKKRKQDEDKNTKTKKPPKRVKLPKAERAPPPEKDQLAYLRQYADEREKWKFSKQKQNWILKNIEEVPQSYEKSLVVYVEGMQGGARERLVINLKKVVEEWNKVAQEIEDKVNAELYGKKSEEKEEEEKEKEKKEEEKKEESGPLRDYAVRCNKLLKALDEEVELKGVEREDDEKEEVKEEVKEEAKEEEEENEEVAKNAEEEEDNLVFEDIEVEDYQYSTEDGGELEANSQPKKEEKGKKVKKAKEEKKEKKVKKDKKKEKKHKK